MADTRTPNYNWIQPMVGGDATTWGTTLNDDLALIDAQVYANEQATVLIGSIIMYGGANPPANWLICNGQSLPTVGAYAGLFAVIGYIYGGSGTSFNVPNLQARVPIGVGVGTDMSGQEAGFGLGQPYGEYWHTLSGTEIPSHEHGITDVAHNHSVNQYYHDHAYSQTPHGHGITDNQHSHNYAGEMSGIGPGGGSGLVNAGSSVTSPASSNIGIQAQYANINFNGDTSAISLNASGTNLSVTNPAGGSGSHNNIQPLLAVNFIIRFQ